MFKDNGHTYVYFFLSIDTESINFDYHLRCGGWLNYIDPGQGQTIPPPGKNIW